jgi:hypothetical protein
VSALAAPPMPKSESANYCTYASTKIDDEVLPLAQAAALLTGRRTVQELISDAVNEFVAKALGRKPVRRRPPKAK